MYDKLVAKVNNIDTSGFFKKTKYDIDKSDLEKKISVADKKTPLILVDLSKKTNYNIKITEIEGIIPSITGLAITAELTTVKNKIPNASNSARKTDYDAEILGIKSKYFTTANCNKFTNEKIDLKVKQKGLVINLLLLDS